MLRTHHASRVFTVRAGLALGVSTLAVATSLVSESAFAQATTDSVGIEEIIVTAQKREEQLQDVPISMTVLGGVQLDRATGQGVHEALSRVAGVTIDIVGGQGSVAGGTQVGVRGVTAPASYI